MSDTPYRPRSPVAVGSFLVVAVVTLALFVPTFSAHVAVLNVVSIDATPTDYAVADDGENVVVRIRIHNPTSSPVTAQYSTLYGNVNGETVTTLQTQIEETTISPGETETLTARVGIQDGERGTVADAIEAGRLRVTGQIRGTIQDAEVEIEVTEGDG